MKFDPESNLPLRSIALLLFAAAISSASLFAKTVVFWQPGFPVLDSQPVDRAALTKALDGMSPVFADVAALKDSATLADADLLVLPYGSSVPVDAWQAIERYLQAGGNLFIVGGKPLHMPVTQADGKFLAQRPQDTYSRTLYFEHTSEVPVAGDAQFQWRDGHPWPAIARLRARRYFAVEGHLDGLAYMVDRSGLRMAAPVIAAGHGAGRVVCLDFDPEPGYWESEDGIALVRQAASYAMQVAIELSVETLFSTLRPGEPPVITAHISSPGPRREQQQKTASGELKLTLADEKGTIDSATVPVTLAGAADVPAPFHKALPAGFYTISATYSEGGEFRAFYRNGFFVADANHVASGPALGVRGDFLTRDGAPFFPVGTNYFSTESNGWDFSGPRNAWVWDKDFAEMAQHGVTFVRTGVWMPYGRFIEGAAGGGANERFLRNVEGFLLAARRHNIAVNFTFFAFAPRTGIGPWREENAPGTPPNPYLDPTELRMEQAYVRSVVERFKDVPWLSWDLINEPSFSNPRAIFKGNSPNGDPAEVAAWRKWLRRKYDGKLAALADAWAVPEDQLGSFDAVPLPAAADIAPERYGNPRQVHALDYNLFAQDMFSDWVRSMVTVIRATGSTQLVDVGQDEGGVTDRVLNQFYSGAGVSFTTNHTYWQDDALLWDSIAAKRPGLPNITGETGYQPVHAPDGAWRYDEFTGLGLIERKWALGFAAGSSGAVQWDWDREADFGMLRSDGSSKAWENMMRDMGEFARTAAPYATKLQLPEVAILLPQSFQLSVGNKFALEAQQNAVRALWGYARADAYAVGEYQVDLLGSPKLIIVPSPMVLTGAAWTVIEERVKAGAVLLITGPFDADAHFHATGRKDAIGIPYSDAPLTIREHVMHFPGGDESLTFSGVKTTFLSRAVLPNAEDWMEIPLGSGRILFSPLPLELNDNLRAVGDVYRYALKTARIAPAYSTAMNDAGILICPTRFPGATLYVITSESDQAAVSFEDARSGKRFDGTLQPGRAAMLLVGPDGKLVASYNWTER
jgi:Beta-galactosidase